MKYKRRPDLNNVTRLEIAVQAFLGMGVYGEITRIARCYRVSRWFAYQLLWQLMLVYKLEVGESRSSEGLRREVDRHILVLRFEGRCSLEGISHSLKQFGLPWTSVGYISQRLAAYARAVPREDLSGAKIVFLLSDEIFTRGQPILLTVEPRSLAILKIELVEQLEAESWQQHWEELAAAGLIRHQRVVADQGPSLVKGCALMGLSHHPDLFHLLRGLAKFGARFYRQALGAIGREYERGELRIGHAERVISRRRGEYEAAKAEAEEKIRRYDNFCYLWEALREALELCDASGQLPELSSRQAEIAAILELLRELKCEQLKQEVKSLAVGLEGYWGYYQRAEVIFQELLQRYPSEVVQALACGWQVERRATNNKDYRVRKQLAREAEFYYDYAAGLLPTAAAEIRMAVVTALDEEVRSSSLIENVNSTLRPLLETCRGQVDQGLLDLFAYVHNHRRFDRGKRAGKAPIEILTGKQLDKPWLESLLATS